MTTYKTGRLYSDPFGIPLINTGVPIPNTNQFEQIDVQGHTFENAPTLTTDSTAARWAPCLYDPSAAYRERNDRGDYTASYPKYNGKLFILPVAKAQMTGDTIAMDASIALLTVFILTGAKYDGHIVNDYFTWRKFQYFVSKDMSLEIIQGLIVRACTGDGTFNDRLERPDWANIPENKAIKGADMAKYNLPWHLPGVPYKPIDRPFDWQKNYLENGVEDADTVYCHLYKKDNKLASYPGAGKAHWAIEWLLEKILY